MGEERQAETTEVFPVSGRCLLCLGRFRVALPQLALWD